jgi:hypothetical protein
MSGCATGPFHHHDEIKIQLLYFHIITCRFLLSPHDCCCQTAITSIKRRAVKAFFSEFSNVQAPVFSFIRRSISTFIHCVCFPMTLYFYDFIAALPFQFSPATQFSSSLSFSFHLSGKMQRCFFNCPTIITALIMFFLVACLFLVWP